MTQNNNIPPEGFPKQHPVYGEFKTVKNNKVVIYTKNGEDHGIDINDKSYLYLKNDDGIYVYDSEDGVLVNKTGKIKLPPPTNFNFDPKNSTSQEALLFEEFVNNPNNNNILEDAYNKYNLDYGSEKPLTFPAFKKSLIEGNKYVYATKNAYVDQSTLNHPMWDLKIKDGKISTSGDKNVFAKDYARYIGFDSEFNDNFILDYQGAYVSLAKTSVDPNYKDIFVNQNLSLLPDGVTDQMAIEQLGKGITPRDGWWGNTNNQQKVTYKSLPIEDSIVETKKTSVANERDPFTEDKVKSGEDFGKEKPLLDTWFAPDITNFVGAITDPINRYEPAQGKVNLVTPGYDLLDPTRQLAANQEQMARYQYMLENSVDPQIALSASLAASGEGFQNAANALANVENANVGIVNQAYQQNATIENQETAMNENARQKYIAEMAMLNENMDKAKSLKKWRVINAYNQGWHNFNKDQMMEQVLFPQVHTDNITGLVQYSGNGRAIDKYNTYNNLYSMGNSQNPIPSTDALKSYYDDLIEKKFSPEFAEKLLLEQISTKKKNNRSIEQAYAEAQGLLSQQFGGAFNINDYIGI
jgi:hypothetical protein